MLLLFFLLILNFYASERPALWAVQCETNLDYNTARDLMFDENTLQDQCSEPEDFVQAIQHFIMTNMKASDTCTMVSVG
jgi:hypothetical protein